MRLQVRCIPNRGQSELQGRRQGNRRAAPQPPLLSVKSRACSGKDCSEGEGIRSLLLPLCLLANSSHDKSKDAPTGDASPTQPSSQHSSSKVGTAHVPCGEVRGMATQKDAVLKRVAADGPHDFSDRVYVEPLHGHRTQKNVWADQAMDDSGSERVTVTPGDDDVQSPIICRRSN
jgi:hypothetical protein